MKLFKNGVGRPSNETKELRRVFVVSVAAIIISLVTLLVVGLSKSGILTGSLKGATSWTVSYGLWEQNSNDINISSYPNYKSHTGIVKFPSAPVYTVKSGKTCSFKGWIFQKQDDGRYRYITKDGKYVWYRSSLDSGKYNISRYAFFGPGSSYKLGAIKVKLYAAFDCQTSSSSGSGSGSTSTAVSSDKIRIIYQKNANAATGTMSSQELKKGNKLSLNHNKFELEGYKFIGWKAYRIVNGSKRYFVTDKGWTGTSSSMGTTIANGTLFGAAHKILTSTGGGSTIYFEAQWQENSGKSGYYTIVFKKNGGMGSMPNQEIEKASGNWGSTNLNANKFSRSGYTFAGWKAYRIISGNKKYFVKGNGWVGTLSSNGTLIGNKVDIQKNYADGAVNETYDIDKYTSAGKYIYLEAQWNQNTTTTKNTTTGVRKWTVIINKGTGSFKKNNNGTTKSFTLTLKSNETLPSCVNYLEKSGYTCTGWKLYRDTRSGAKYFVSGKGWTGNYQQGLKFSNNSKISSIYNFTGDGATIYITPEWQKK